MMGSNSTHRSQLVLKAFSGPSMFGPLKLLIGIINWVTIFSDGLHVMLYMALILTKGSCGSEEG